MKKLILFLVASISYGAVTIKTVRTTGGTHAGTLAGIQDAVDECAALDSTDPCIVDIEAGETYSDGSACFLTLPAQTEGPKMIVLRSSRISELAENVRVTAADALKMAKIENACASSQAVILAAPETTGTPGAGVASHYLLQGLDIHYSGEGRNAGGTVNIGYDPNANAWAKAYWQAPHTITVDRCWMHGNDLATWQTNGTTTHSNQHGVLMNGRNIVLKNSRISEALYNNGESHGILAYNSPGALYIFNNHIEGSIGSLLGGSDTAIPALVNSGTWFYGNEYTRNGLDFHWYEWDTTDTLNTSEPCITGSLWQQAVSPLDKWKCVAGAWESTTDSRPNRNWTKNAWECKNCRMSFVEGNYIHDIPATGDQSQYGYAFLLNNVDSAYDAPQGRPEHIAIRHNRVARVGQGPTFSWNYTPIRHTNNVTIENNVFENIAGPEVSPTQGTSLISGGGWMLQASGVQKNLRIAKNTFLYRRTFSGGGVRLSEDAPMTENVYLQDNILPWGIYGQSTLNNANEACSAFRGVMLGSVYWDYFGLVDTNSRGSTAYTNLYGQSACPTNQSRAATWADVKFVDYNDGEDGDYRLCTGSGTPHASCDGASPWATAASDGGPLGADAAQVKVLTDDAAAGTFDPGKYAVRVKRVSSNEIAYVAREPQGVCQVSVTRGGSTVFNGNDGASLGSMERTVDPDLDTNGEHVVRVRCQNAAATEAVWREVRWVRAE